MNQSHEKIIAWNKWLNFNEDNHKTWKLEILLFWIPVPTVISKKCIGTGYVQYFNWLILLTDGKWTKTSIWKLHFIDKLVSINPPNVSVECAQVEAIWSFMKPKIDFKFTRTSLSLTEIDPSLLLTRLGKIRLRVCMRAVSEG